jgi:hypothetical protein
MLMSLRGYRGSESKTSFPYFTLSIPGNVAVGCIGSRDEKERLFTLRRVV